MKKSTRGDKKDTPARRTVKKQAKKSTKKSLAREYRLVFSPPSLPYEGQYADEDSLEQPSALRYVPSTTRTTAEMAPDPQLRRDAKLVRDF
ncbi:MAG TPA: hypothetical protein VN976_02745 [Verrucomicrobiae bacterium]|nr:hypothetical protein [Verrucomicrobiae bacterium]